MTDRMGNLVDEWKEDLRIGPDILAATVLMPRAPQWASFPDWVDPAIRHALAGKGIERPYVHQAEAMELARRGRHLVLVTPTASGKTLAYNIPVLQAVKEDPSVRALYMFPTKALAQDQYHELLDLAGKAGIPARTHTFDGDTPGDARASVKEFGNVVMTNPDMLHSGIMPRHPSWLKLFRNLKFVVIDEVHTYRGVFGSHLANVIRRLRRIARFHGSDPVFIFCSATIANPGDLASRLLGEQVEVVDRTGSPQGRRHVVLYNPPIVNRELGIRASYIKRARNLAIQLLKRRVSVIVFALSRLNVELLVKYLREALVREHMNPDVIQGYRGGYLPSRRREIERGLRAGEIRGVVATNALELGIDIGSLDACIVAGYPGTQASLWQQWGRAGRTHGSSLSILVARSAPMDQYMVNHPDFLLGLSPEQALIDPDNLFILVDHLKCAAFELPFHQGQGFGDIPPERTAELLDFLAEGQVLHRAGQSWHWMQETYPASAVSLRNIPGQNFVVIDTEREQVIAEVDFVGAHTTLHQEAIHNVDGDQYQVKHLDYEGRKAYVEKVVSDYYTDAESYVQVKVISVEDGADSPDLVREFGDVAVTEKVVGFKKIRFYTSENVGYGQVNLPELTMHTISCWITLKPRLLEGLAFTPEEVQDGLLGLGRAMHFVAAMHLMCDPHDLGRCIGDRTGSRLSTPQPDSRGVCAPTDEEAAQGPFEPTLFFYDRRPGGVGLTTTLHRIFAPILAHTRALISACPCTQGCPACIGPSASEAFRSKDVALILGSRITAALESGNG